MRMLLEIWPELGRHAARGPGEIRRCPSATKKGPGRYHSQGYSRPNNKAQRRKGRANALAALFGARQ